MAYDRLSQLDRREFLATVGTAGAVVGAGLECNPDSLFAASQAALGH